MTKEVKWGRFRFKGPRLVTHDSKLSAASPFPPPLPHAGVKKRQESVATRKRPSLVDTKWPTICPLIIVMRFF